MLHYLQTLIFITQNLFLLKWGFFSRFSAAKPKLASKKNYFGAYWKWVSKFRKYFPAHKVCWTGRLAYPCVQALLGKGAFSLKK